MASYIKNDTATVADAAFRHQLLLDTFANQQVDEIRRTRDTREPMNWHAPRSTTPIERERQLDGTRVLLSAW